MGGNSSSRRRWWSSTRGDVNMNFKKWYLNEVGTSTASIAVFSLPVFGGPLATRMSPDSILGLDPWDADKKHKRKKHKKHKKHD